MPVGIGSRGVVATLLVVLATSLLAGSQRAFATPSASTDPSLFVSSFSQGTITRIDLDTLATTAIVSGLSFPEDGVCGPDGRIYFAESFAGRITRFEQNGSGATRLTTNGERAEGLAFDVAGNLYFNTRVESPTGVWKITGADPAAAPVNVVPPFSGWGEGTAIAQNQDILAVASPEGKVVRSPFPAYGPPTDFITGLQIPVGIDVGPEGNIYVADGAARNLQKFADDGSFLGVVASGLPSPVFIEVDSLGNSYVTNYPTGEIVKIASDGTQTMLAVISGAIGIALCEPVTGTIIVEKQTLPDGSSDVFGFTGALSASLRDGESASETVQPGVHIVTESLIPSGWVPNAITCTDIDSSGDATTATISFRVDSGETVKCTVTNTRPGVFGTPAGGQAIAELYAPLVYLHPAETNWPLSADQFIQGSTLYFVHDFGCPDERVAAFGAINPTVLGEGGYSGRAQRSLFFACIYEGPLFFSGGSRCGDNGFTRPFGDPDTSCTRLRPLDETKEGFVLDLADALRGGTPTTANPGAFIYTGTPVYYYYASKKFITYWFPFAFNKARLDTSRLIDLHEGDWESITIRLNSVNEPTHASYQHHGHTHVLEWANVPTVSGTHHPVVYTALGSHGSYPFAGTQNLAHVFPGGQDVTAAGLAWKTWNDMRDVTAEAWYGYGGSWGQVGGSIPGFVGHPGATTGPLGPSPYKAFGPCNTGTLPCYSGPSVIVGPEHP